MSDEITVVKCGGGLTDAHEEICRDLAGLPAGRAVLVHGGAAEVDRLAERLGVPQRRLTTPSGSSSRYTDPATLELLLMTLVGKVKPALVAALARHGARPVGLTGMDAALVRAERSAAHRAVLDGRTVVVRDDHSGRIRGTDAALLLTLLEAGCLPVVSPPALGAEGPVNVDADRLAAALAGALARTRPVRLVLLTSAPGVLRDPADEGSLVRAVDLSDGPVAEAAVRGGMTAKLQAARKALDAGTGTVVIADGRVAAPVSAALDGAGTTVTSTATLRSL
ncbi:[LysW]-aminoadipate kinase [Streptomyces sp. enrichment culture]|uniref:[LysW]-aminoadipate kinase n=1 Tax=Streptomyces sp. enrichment culture TaxID=1795815 RepID=UPI003F54601D